MDQITFQFFTDHITFNVNMFDMLMEGSICCNIYA